MHRLTRRVIVMKIEILYILDCPWCLRTKESVRKGLKELGADADVKEILIDSGEKSVKHDFVGSPTVIIDGKDIQEEVSRGRCLPCEKLAEHTKKATGFVKQECACGCRTYFYKGRRYPYPPKEMIKDAVRKRM